MSPRKAFINNNGYVHDGYLGEKLLGYIYDAMQLASTHDPDHGQVIRRHDRWINRLYGRVAKLEKKRK
jgi:hypothetical protein